MSLSLFFSSSSSRVWERERERERERDRWIDGWEILMKLSNQSLPASAML